MKILHVHKYFNKMRSGGSITAFFETKKLLESHRHEVMVFSMENIDNEKSKYSKCFAEHFDVNDAKSILKKIKYSARLIYNFEAEKKMESFLQKEKPDIAHVHDIYHYLTPSILYPLKKYNIPIVMKLSDYKLVCPNYKLFSNGDICKRCKNNRYFNAVIQRCHMDSHLKSLIVALEAYLHFFLKSYDKVDFFLAPSEFMRETCMSFGISGDRIKILRNVLNFKDYVPTTKKEKYFLYAGRLSEEKGLKTMLDAVNILKTTDKLEGYKVVIMGEGPYEISLKKYVDKLILNDVVEFVGFLKKGTENWKEIMQKATCSILPSNWYDNSPVAVSESMAFGTPVIVSDRGGTKEMIEDNKSGYVFEAKNSVELANKMKQFINNPEKILFFSKNAVLRVNKINNEKLYYEKLIKYYNEVIRLNFEKN